MQDLTKDKLFQMFEKQVQLQKKLGNENIIRNQQFININILAAIDELMESIRETPWKPWKKEQTFNSENFKNELIDVWHFIINLSLSAGMSSEEVYKRFIIKNKINKKRKQEGY